MALTAFHWTATILLSVNLVGLAMTLRDKARAQSERVGAGIALIVHLITIGVGIAIIAGVYA